MRDICFLCITLVAMYIDRALDYILGPYPGSRTRSGSDQSNKPDPDPSLKARIPLSCDLCGISKSLGKIKMPA